MKIATWNIERPGKFSGKLKGITELLIAYNPDILVLTETNENVYLAENYKCFHTAALEQPYYKPGERRVSIYSKYDAIGVIKTFRDDTSICVKYDTPIGELAVYGTVIGIHGNRRKSFMEDLDSQIEDFESIGKNANLCICGDLNVSFSDNYYYTKEGRNKLVAVFEKMKLDNLTAGIRQNIDHIIIPESICCNCKIDTSTGNDDKKLSDHIMVGVEIFYGS